MRDEFVKEMRKAIADQRAKASQDQQEKLHDAGVIRGQSQNIWDDLRRQSKSLVGSIGDMVYNDAGDGEFVVVYGKRTATVTLDKQGANIRYTFSPDNSKSGSFRPEVQGMGLVYYEQATFDFSSPLQKTAAILLLTTEAMAEKLISKLVG